MTEVVLDCRNRRHLAYSCNQTLTVAHGVRILAELKRLQGNFPNRTAADITVPELVDYHHVDALFLTSQLDSGIEIRRAWRGLLADLRPRRSLPCPTISIRPGIRCQRGREHVDGGQYAVGQGVRAGGVGIVECKVQSPTPSDWPPSDWPPSRLPAIRSVKYAG